MSHQRLHTTLVAAASLSLLFSTVFPTVAYAVDDPSTTSPEATSTENSAQTEEAQPDTGAQTPDLPSLDFDGIIPDDANFRIPAAADRYKQADGTYVIGRPLSGGSAAGAVVPGLEAFYQQKIEWGPCGDFDPVGEGNYTNSVAQCGYLIVPMDYSNPSGPTIAIGLYKVPAQDQANKIGSLFVDPGGPGGSGMSTANSFVTRGAGVVRERFDYIGFDPRGVGSSLPMIRCQSSDAFDKQRQDNDWYTTDQYTSISEYNTSQCYTNTGSQFNISGEGFINNVGTINVIRDLDIARSAVGDTKINYLGYSYGTSIGYHYAKMFPDNIRALVIDGVVNPFENNPDGAQEYTKYTESTSGGMDSELTQMQGFQATFEQYLKACAQNDGFADQGYPQPCATGTDLNTALAEYQKIAQSTWKSEKYVASDGRKLSFFDMSQATILAMYAEFLWPMLNKALHDLKTTGNPDGAFELADWYYDRSEEGKYDFGTLGAFPTIWCNDYGVAEGAANLEDAANRKKALYQVAPFMDPGVDENGQPRSTRTEVDWCTYYKNSHTLPQGENLKALANILVISTTYDPSTPYQDGVVAADAVDGTLLTVAGNDHTAYSPGAGNCAAQITEAYLVNLIVPTDITGDQGVDTKDIFSNVTTGNQCRVDSFRSTPAIQPVVTNPGFEVEILANGLVRNTQYLITLPAELGGNTVTATSNEMGELSVPVMVAKDVAPGTYTVSLAPADPTQNDPTVTATGELKVVPFLVKEDIAQIIGEGTFVELPVIDPWSIVFADLAALYVPSESSAANQVQPSVAPSAGAPLAVAKMDEASAGKVASDSKVAAGGKLAFTGAHASTVGLMVLASIGAGALALISRRRH